MFSGNQNENAVQHTLLRPGMAFVVIIFGALIAFEIFNYSTTELALSDLLGELNFAGMRWATILALAFCGIDFAGIARLFTPEQGANEPKEVWYLFAAWLLAATMNAILTWWGVSMAVVSQANHSAIVDAQTVTGAVPVFVAVMVWVIRILIIGTLSLAVDRMLHPQGGQAQVQAQPPLVQRPLETRTNYTQAAAQTPSRAPGGFGSAGTAPRSVAAKGSSTGSGVSEGQASPRPRVEGGYHSVGGKTKRS